MANQELLDYIMRQRVHGASVNNIKNALLHAGWEERDVDQGLAATEKSLVKAPPPPVAVVKPDVPDAVAITEAHAKMPEVPSSSVIAPNPIAANIVGDKVAPAKKPATLMIILLVLGIVLVASAAGFIYFKFLRVQSPAPVAVTQSTSTTPDNSLVEIATSSATPDASQSAPTQDFTQPSSLPSSETTATATAPTSTSGGSASATSSVSTATASTTTTQ